MPRYKNSSFRKNTTAIFLLLVLTAGLVVATVLQGTITNFLPSANNNESKEFVRSQCLQQNQCLGKLSKDQKQSCYERCNNNSQVTTAANRLMDPEDIKKSHKKFIDNFLTRYASTPVSQWRRVAVENTKSLDPNYFRTVCNVAGTGAFKGMLEGKKATDKYYVSYADKLTAVMDEYETWATTYGGKWSSGANGYNCLLAASLLWDKLPSASGWDKASAQSKIGVNTNPKRSASDKRTYMKQRFEQLADMIVNDYSAEDFKAIQKQRVNKPGAGGADVGNSIAEEAGWNGAYLALAAELLPVSKEKKDKYTKTAKELMWLSLERGSIEKDFPVTKDNYVVNHNLLPHPQYGFSILSTTAHASLAQYKFGNNARDKVANEYRRFDTNENVFTWTDIFETQLTMVDRSDFTLKGKICLYNEKKQCKNLENNTYKVSPYTFKGVSEWGTGIWFQNGVFAFSYVIDPYDWNGYRSNSSPYSALLSYQNSKADAKQLHLPSTYKDGKWSYERLSEAKPAKIGYLAHPYGSQADNVDAQINTHFFLNSLAAFEDMISYIYIDDKVWLQKLN